MLYEEFSRLVTEGRANDREVFMALEMLCADYDEKVANLSVSWAEIQVRAIGDDRS